MIAAQILVIAGFLSITWGIYFAGTIILYAQERGKPPGPRKSKDLIVAMRRVVVALCVWLFVFSFVFRTFCVLIGIEDDVAAQIVFFALLGSNVVGSIFAAVSLKYD